MAHVPFDAAARSLSGLQDDTTKGPTARLSSIDGWLGAVVGLYQISASIITLYRSRGNQITRYGYAALGLTVIPYILRTVLNLLGRIFTRDYEMLYMVASPEMTEAIERGGFFEGMVGELVPMESMESNPFFEELLSLKVDSISPEDGVVAFAVKGSPGEELSLSAVNYFHETLDLWISCCSLFTRKAGATSYHHSEWRMHLDCGAESQTLALAGGLSLVSLVLALYGALSRFQQGTHSTSIQRGFIMSWIVLGSTGNAFASSIQTGGISLKAASPLKIVRNVSIYTLSGLFVPAIGGMVIVED